MQVHYVLDSLVVAHSDYKFYESITLGNKTYSNVLKYIYDTSSTVYRFHFLEQYFYREGLLAFKTNDNKELFVVQE